MILFFILLVILAVILARMSITVAAGALVAVGQLANGGQFHSVTAF